MSEKKSTGKSAGSTKNWRQLGGGKRLDGEESESQDSQPSKSSTTQPSERQDVQPLEHPTIQDAEQLDTQPSRSQDKGESSMQDLATAEHPSAQKSKDNKQPRDKATVYLEPELNDWVRQQVIIEKRRRGHHVEISDIINEALRKAKENK